MHLITKQKMLQLQTVKINTIQSKRSNPLLPILNGGNDAHIKNYCFYGRELHKHKRPWYKDLC